MTSLDLINAPWRTSTRSGGNNCVEVAILAEAVAVRDTKDRPGPALVFRRDTWATFVEAAKGGAFDGVR